MAREVSRWYLFIFMLLGGSVDIMSTLPPCASAYEPQLSH